MNRQYGFPGFLAYRKMANALWGEFSGPRFPQWENVVPKEIGKLVILSAIKPEIPKVKQPQPDGGVDKVLRVGPEHSLMENNVLYTIKLMEHAKQVSELIRLAKSGEGEPSIKIKKCPPIPTAPIREYKYKGPLLPPNADKNRSPFTLGLPRTLPNLGKEVTKEILFKSVATICAHAGFDSAMQSSLQVLTDVAEDFFKRFARLLRCAVDREHVYGISGFPDSMERVFFEMGFGSMYTLKEFYEKRVLAYRKKCHAQCLALVKEHEAVLPSLKRKREELVRFKTEMECEEDIPEIHFPAMAEGDCVSSLEPGFQMLHSLEQEVQLQSSMEQDDGNTNFNAPPLTKTTTRLGSETWRVAIRAKKRKRKLPL